jgi:hypothetical protein
MTDGFVIAQQFDDGLKYLTALLSAKQISSADADTRKRQLQQHYVGYLLAEQETMMARAKQFQGLAASPDAAKNPGLAAYYKTWASRCAVRAAALAKTRSQLEESPK